DQPGAVAGLGGFAEEFGVALPQLGDGQALEGGDLVDDVQFHRVLSFWGFSQRSTRVDSEPRFGGERKAIRDKKERFIESRKMAECGGILAREPSVTVA